MPTIGQWTRDWAAAHSIPCVYAEQTGSTNDLAKDAVAPGGPPLALFVADSQTQGRGRDGAKWVDSQNESQKGAHLLATFSFAMASPPQPILSPLVGLAVYRALARAYPGLAFALKAPNDAYVGGEKLAGILIETVDLGSARRAAIGIGLNVLAAPSLDAPKNGAQATSLAAAGAPQTEAAWRGFLDALVSELRRAASAGLKSELASDDRAALRDALNRNPRLESPILEVDPLGQLKTKAGLVRWQDL